MTIRKRIIKPKKLAQHTIPSDMKAIPRKLPSENKYQLEAVFAPYSNYSLKASRFPVEIQHVKRSEIICGVAFNRGGIGSLTGTVAWVCTTLTVDVSKSNVTDFDSVETAGYRPSYVFLGFFDVSKKISAEEAREAAIEAIYEAYEDFHKVNLFQE